MPTVTITPTPTSFSARRCFNVPHGCANDYDWQSADQSGGTNYQIEAFGKTYSFAIPAGIASITSGYWQVTGSYSVAGGAASFGDIFVRFQSPLDDIVESATQGVGVGTKTWMGLQIPIDAGQTAEILAASGGSISIRHGVRQVIGYALSNVLQQDMVAAAGLVLVLDYVPTCSYAILPSSASYGAAGGTGTVAVTTGVACAWTAVANNSWLHVTAGTPGSGNGTVDYSVDANTPGPTSARVGTITIAGLTFTVTQAGEAGSGGGGGGGSSAVCTPIGKQQHANATESLYFCVQFPTGYIPATNLLTLLGIMAFDSHFTVKARSLNVSALIDSSGVLACYDMSTGLELANGVALDGVDVWWHSGER